MLAIMFADINQLGQVVAFSTIALVGLVVLAFAAFVGGHGSHDVDGHSGDHAGEHHAADAVVSVFSTKIISVFSVGFGIAGAVASLLEVKLFPSIGAGLGTGVLMAAIAFFSLSLLYKQQANSLVTGEGMIGQKGRVTTAIPAQGCGEVGVTLQQQYGTHMARSKDGCAIPSGQTIKVIARVGGVLEVERA